MQKRLKPFRSCLSCLFLLLRSGLHCKCSLVCILGQQFAIAKRVAGICGKLGGVHAKAITVFGIRTFSRLRELVVCYQKRVHET